MLTKIATYGCCATRDLFNKAFVSDWKNHFQLVSYQQLCSIVSLMSKPIDIELGEELQGELSNFEKSVFKQDVLKSFLETLKTTQPEYLVLDFHVDTFNGFIELTDGGIITNRIVRYKKLDIFNKMEARKVFSPLENTTEFRKRWIQSFNRFMQFMKENCPNTQIIINRLEVARMYYSLDNQMESMIERRKTKDHHTAETLAKIDECIDYFERYAMNNFDLQSLDFNSEEYFGAENNPWGTCYMHYNPYYYKKKFKDLWNIVENHFHAPTKLASFAPGGLAKQIPLGVTKLSDMDEVGVYYLTNATYLQMEDRPTTDNAGYFFIVYPRNGKNGYMQELRKSTAAFSIQIFVRITDGKESSKWNMVNSGFRTLTIPDVTSISEITEAGEYYITAEQVKKLQDHPTKKNGWFLTVSKKNHDSLKQLLTKNTQNDNAFEEYVRLVNVEKRTNLKWRKYHFDEANFSIIVAIRNFKNKVVRRLKLTKA
ncbi:teichoic acid biosynthesis protein [Listeria monocytogenes]